MWEGLPSPPRQASDPVQTPKTMKDAIEDLERRMIEETLESTGGNQLRTARILGLSRQGLINKIKRFELA
jgi:DNA-binding NtrC family response regulator